MAYRSGELRLDDPDAGRLRVSGDGYAAAGELVTLIVSPDVHRFLSMSDDEVAEASAIDRRYREALRRVYSGGQWRPPHVDPAAAPAREEVAHAVGRLLGDERTSRLHRLSWRIQGGDALLDDGVPDVLQLTAEQRRQVETVAEENEREYARVLAQVDAVRGRQAARTSDPELVAVRARRAHDAGRARLLALLTVEQRARFAQLSTGGG
ncbi:MAG TPA: hypothetical protein VN520_21325 [Streptomyces sp.]|jgi:hypothetical protein|uniref:hypothetical protein n=1 Tax=Streptomyces sp. TaxID=1931 RepID=UPI002B96745F|nr:hypothetical protein [Streptomyces sp.]HWU08890.1 hypothetical protein [Streptomyces sp.]